MRFWNWGFVLLVLFAVFLLNIDAFELRKCQNTERFSGRKRNSSASSTSYISTNIWSKKSCFLKKDFDYCATICPASEDAISFDHSIFVYFRGLFYDVGNDPEGGYYARGARAAVWENFKENPLIDISTEHQTTYYEDMKRVILRKQRLLANSLMKQAMLFPHPAQPGDTFHQILNGLARKLPHDKSVGDLKPW